MKKRTWEVLWDCLRRHRGAVYLYFAMALVSFCVFRLYSLPLEAFFYAFLLVGAAGAVCFAVCCLTALRASHERTRLEDALLTGSSFPEPRTLAEKDYQRMLAALSALTQKRAEETEKARQEAEDYLTAWVHQIKTPISVLRMRIAQEPADKQQALNCEIFRMEQYVEMVLQYMRLGAVQKDLVIREYALEELIRQSIRKFAPQFILRKLTVQFAGTDRRIVTDQKWFCSILDQLLSNAVKYTPSGGVTVAVEEGIVRISDTGIGIAPEDLPCIFNKGYTGQNGRLQQKASGLGLYLAKRAADLLSIPLRAESTPGVGTTFYLDVRQEQEVPGK